MKEKIKENTVANRIAKVLVDIFFYGGIAVYAALPFVAGYLLTFRGAAYETDMQKSVTLYAVYLSGAVCIYIMWQLKTMFRTLSGGNPFVHRNVSALRRIAAGCFVVTAVYAAKCIVAFTFTSMTIGGVFAVGGLLCLTLKDIFKRAVLYKEENDLTV